MQNTCTGVQRKRHCAALSRHLGAPLFSPVARNNFSPLDFRRRAYTFSRDCWIKHEERGCSCPRVIHLNAPATYFASLLFLFFTAATAVALKGRKKERESEGGEGERGRATPLRNSALSAIMFRAVPRVSCQRGGMPRWKRTERLSDLFDCGAFGSVCATVRARWRRYAGQEDSEAKRRGFVRSMRPRQKRR